MTFSEDGTLVITIWDSTGTPNVDNVHWKVESEKLLYGQRTKRPVGDAVDVLVGLTPRRKSWRSANIHSLIHMHFTSAEVGP